ncbi:MAG: 50S ribosomal protein L6 [Alphaproteobacteria bacterium]|nr:50S ribosomal protein L6 [Alphaproteobacteria bacterium]
MSRVGKNEIALPSSVEFKHDGGMLTVTGKMGAETLAIPECLKMENSEKGVRLVPVDDDRKTRILWGTTQRNLANAVKGVSEGFTINMELNGVGYRAAVAGKRLTLQLGYSHDIVYDIPDGITIKSEKPTAFSISGASKQQIGQIAAYLRAFRKPEPYKGKGIMRAKEFVVRKEGKKK